MTPREGPLARRRRLHRLVMAGHEPQSQWRVGQIFVRTETEGYEAKRGCSCDRCCACCQKSISLASCAPDVMTWTNKGVLSNPAWNLLSWRPELLLTSATWRMRWSSWRVGGSGGRARARRAPFADNADNQFGCAGRPSVEHPYDSLCSSPRFPPCSFLVFHTRLVLGFSRWPCGSGDSSVGGQPSALRRPRAALGAVCVLRTCGGGGHAAANGGWQRQQRRRCLR